MRPFHYKSREAFLEIQLRRNASLLRLGSAQSTGQLFDPKDGDRVVKVSYWKHLQKGGCWYIPTNETGIVWVLYIVDPDLHMLGISQDNRLPRGYPQGVPPLVNSSSCRTKQSADQLRLLGRAKLIPQTRVASISAEIERRKMLDYEIDNEQEDWETEENNEEETQENPLLSAINWSVDS